MSIWFRYCFSSCPKVKERERGKQGEFMIAPNFKEGVTIQDLDKDKQRIQIIKDNTPF